MKNVNVKLVGDYEEMYLYHVNVYRTIEGFDGDDDYEDVLDNIYAMKKENVKPFFENLKEFYKNEDVSISMTELTEDTNYGRNFYHNKNEN